MFWTDLIALLQMIVNTNKHFLVFVANKLTKIEYMTLNQWQYIPSKKNPADLATQGIDVKLFVSKLF